MGAANDEAEDDLDTTVPSRLRGPLTRSSMKPRLLFPTEKKLVAEEKEYAQADEEADTDIEDTVLTTPSLETDKVATPRAPRYAPVSPPSTVARITRSKKISSDADLDALSIPRLGSASLFDSWQRTKPRGQKRENDSIDIFEDGNHKRLRG